jgi:hypothetical protein
VRMFKKLSTLLLIVLVIGCLASCAKFSHLESGSDNTDTRPSHSITHSSDDTKPEEYYTAFRQGEFSVSAYLVTPYSINYFIAVFTYDRIIYFGSTRINGSTQIINAVRQLFGLPVFVYKQ